MTTKLFAHVHLAQSKKVRRMEKKGLCPWRFIIVIPPA
jgi:hypothetical protein